jgi:hypothetical protein
LRSQIGATYDFDSDGPAGRGVSTSDGGKATIAYDAAEFVTIDLFTLIIG